ncbi:MAG: hypothetical protein KF767_07085 [Bdellovibrionaceae bacterium]|nr:hypothetical protein [Pseudobdellovibrionaceae bacterium]
MSRSSADAYEPEFIIPSEQISTILAATCESPRAANLQHFQIRYYVSGEELSQLATMFGDHEYLGRCSMALFFFVDLRSTAEWMRSRGEISPFLNRIGFQYAYADAAISMQAAASTAEGLGLQTRILSHCLQRSKAASKVFFCPPGVIPTLILTIGKGLPVLTHPRFHLKIEDFCIRGAAPWKTGAEIYEASGKEAADAIYLKQRPELSARGFAAHPARALARAKYKDYDMESFSQNLDELIEESIVALKALKQES